MRIVNISQPLRPEQTESLSALLIACVREGSVVGFMADLGVDAAGSYWQVMADAACHGRIALLAVEDDAGEIVGTAQVSFQFPPNQAHVACIQMVLVHPDGRRRGIARRLMAVAEELCRETRRSLIVLETAGGHAGSLYASLGYAVGGIVPDFWRRPDGEFTDGYLFHKRIRSRAPEH